MEPRSLRRRRSGRFQRHLISFAGDHLGTDLSLAVIESSLARWRYSWVTNAHPEPFLAASEDPALLFCGDAFGQPKVEGAALSGLAAADYLLGLDSCYSASLLFLVTDRRTVPER